MAEILYKPHCSKCGALITAQVRYSEDKVTLPNYMVMPRYDIEPQKCEFCGDRFDGIEVFVPYQKEGE